MTREVNVQPTNDRRQRDAAALVASQGPRASVFGRRHNDHVWIEYHDRETGRWLPSDPTINIVGLEDWVPARLGFGASDRSWMLELWADNLTDEEYIQVGFDAPLQAGAWNAFLGAPRTYGVTLRVRY